MSPSLHTAVDGEECNGSTNTCAGLVVFLVKYKRRETKEKHYKIQNHCLDEFCPGHDGKC